MEYDESNFSSRRHTSLREIRHSHLATKEVYHQTLFDGWQLQYRRPSKISETLETPASD